jgi:Mrp family chromosome partitioning ATPase
MRRARSWPTSIASSSGRLIANAMGKGAAPVKRGNLIMVTSALAGEGKSFTAINLAMSIAMELDNTVMLVDADVPKPSVLKNAWRAAGARTARRADRRVGRSVHRF